MRVCACVCDPVECFVYTSLRMCVFAWIRVYDYSTCWLALIEIKEVTYGYIEPNLLAYH